MTPEKQESASTRGSTAVLRVVMIYAGFAGLWILLSDRLVGLIARNPGQIILMSTLKGWLFVGVTSLLLYRLIRHQLVPERLEAGAKGRRWLPPVVILGFFIVVLTLVGARQAYHQQEVTEGARLQAIAELKAQQITDWVGERIGDAQFTSSSRVWAKAYHHWLLTRDSGERAQILERLEAFRALEHFQDAVILDGQGVQVLPGPGAVPTEMAEGARAAARSGQVQVVGPYKDAAGRFRLDFLAPLPGEDGVPGPVVALGTDPSEHLFPILQTWPVPSATGEAILFRRQGDQVFYLSESRTHPGEVFGRLRPLGGTPYLATRVLAGEAAHGTLLKGLDYVGAPVAAVARAVPGTDWHLIAKIDRAELDAGAQGQVAFIGLAGLLGLFLAALGHHLFRQQRRLADAEREWALQARFRLLFEAAPVPMCLLDEEDRMVALNGQFTRTFGYDLEAVPDLGQWLLRAYPDPAERDASRAHWNLRPRQGTVPFEANLACRDGERRTMQVSATAIGGESLVTFTDLTDRVRAERERQALQVEIQQAQKMESIGRLAGGVAHDFNNMLGVIVANAEMGLQGDPACKSFARFEEILKAAQRSADLTRQLLAFARKQTVSPKVIDLNEAIPGMLQMLARLIGENISLDYTQRAGLWLIRMDPSQVDQILANLAVNARDAIQGVGSLSIHTENLELREGTASHRRPGQYVVLEVKDTGCGMDAEQQKHIFEPFFTTKAVGKGTGLGLATVYGIVKQNGGFIEVESAPGKGTSLRLHLPRHVGAPEASETTHPLPSPGGHEGILVVEDEPMNLSVTVMLLESLGYGVLGAPSPREALKLLESGAGDLKLLLTDIIMPEMNGRELVARAQAMRPGLKCLYMSGYSDDHLGAPRHGVKLLGKPFTLKDLAASVREALDA